MIKLSCKIKHNFNDLKPFATRINLNLGSEISNQDSLLKKNKTSILIETIRGTVEILDDAINIEDKEIILLYPKVETLKDFIDHQLIVTHFYLQSYVIKDALCAHNHQKTKVMMILIYIKKLFF